jgi:phosphatidylserine/phosphatidylglycerophosphate/cardiolipin synthase-like enzyme
MQERKDQALRLENSRSVRRIHGEEHRAILVEAVRTAQRTLCIRSGYLSSRVLNETLLLELGSAVKRGVEVTIEYVRLIPLQSSVRSWEYKRTEEHRSAECNLSNLINELSKMDLQGRLRYDPTWTHIKELAVDDEWLVVGSFNWLSNQKIARSESSIRLADPKMAEQVRHEANRSLSGISSRPPTGYAAGT